MVDHCQREVDGQLSTSGTSGKGVLTERVYGLGRLDNAAAGLWKGALDEVRIYDQVIDAAAIAALFAAGH